jgi:predicted dinucleotide-binding enzyme
MRIGIIGAGNVGGTLGQRLGAQGHDIVYGVRDPDGDKIKQLLSRSGPFARAASVADTVASTEILILATPYEAAGDALKSAGDLTGRVVIDTTNPGAPDWKSLSIGHTTSAAEEIAKSAPGAKVVKCFNTTGAGNMADPLIGGLPVTMPYCGDDAEAKAAVARLATELGFDPLDAGPLSNARLLEPMAMLWIYLAMHMGRGTDFGYKVLFRS